VELAAFALALTAWCYPGAGGYRKLPELNLACSGLSVSVSRGEWQKLANGNRNLRIALGWIYDEFQNAPVLGSLLDPSRIQLPMGISWKDIAGTLEAVLAKERSDEEHEAGVVAHGLAKAASLLAGKYLWVITNVPYLARGKQSETLRGFCERNYKEAKNDLATVFLDRCLELCVEGGSSSIVLPQNWLFLTSYKEFRKKLLKNDTWRMIARLGPGAFETISGEVVKAILLTISRGKGRSGILPLGFNNKNLEGSATICGLDVSAPRPAAEKATQLITAEIKQVEQAKQLENPDARVALEKTEKIELLEKYANSYQGIKTGDDLQFKRFFWEISSSNRWKFTMGGILNTSIGYSYILDWTVSGKNFARLQGLSAFNQQGLCLTNVSRIIAYDYNGTPFSSEITTIIPKKDEYLPAIKAYAAHPLFEKDVRKLEQNLAISTAIVIKVPFDLDHWTKVAQGKYPNGLPKPYSNDPTQWIFHGHPCGSVIWNEEKKWTAHGPLRTDATVLQVAIARLLGYRWPAELDANMELADEQREWVKRCKVLLPFGHCLYPAGAR